MLNIKKKFFTQYVFIAILNINMPFYDILAFLFITVYKPIFWINIVLKSKLLHKLTLLC